MLGGLAMEVIKREGLSITWLRGGVMHLDGGAMFGVVPKPLWSKKYPANEKNQIELRTDPMLIEKDGKLLLIDSGLGYGRLSEKQMRNFGVLEQSFIKEDLKALGYAPSDIDKVLMTHLHFDHATGLVEEKDGEDVSIFHNATIFTSEIEWREMNEPNIRSKNTYWEKNRIAIAEQIQTFSNEIEVIPGVTMYHTGGHSDGHSIIVIEHRGETFIHMADIMPTHAHKNVLWVLAYDDYPMTSIREKQKWQAFAEENNAYYLFYHDYKYRSIKWDENEEVVFALERKER